MKSQEHSGGKQKRYVTIQDAADLLNIAERTVFRMIDDKRLESMKTPDGSRWIALDDIESKPQAKVHSDSPVRHQLKQVQTLVSELQEARENDKHRIHVLEQQLAAMQQHPSQEPLLIHLSSHEERPEGSSTFSLAEISQFVAKQLALTMHRSSPHPRGTEGMITRRNLPAGTVRLVTFAKEHHLKAYTIKQWYEAGDVPLTVYPRPNPAQRNHNEWWITKEQHQSVIAYCQQHVIPYVACLRCQSQDETDVHVE